MNPATCLDCGDVGHIRGRGLCNRCYQRRSRAGTLTERPPLGKIIADGCISADQLLSDIPGLTYRQLDYWCRAGWLRAPGTGSGNLRGFPGDEVRVAKEMARLVDAGLTPAAAHRVARGERTLAPGVAVLLDAAEVVTVP